MLRRFLSTQPTLQDVVIVGGGPAGLSLLAALKNSPKTQHLSCTLVEASSLAPARAFAAAPPPAYSNRIVSLTPQSVQFMQDKSGSWPFLHAARTKFYDHMIVYDSQDRHARIHFDASGAAPAPQAFAQTGLAATPERPAIAAMCEVLNIQASLLRKIDELNGECDAEDTANVVDGARVDSIAPGAGLDWPVVSLSNGDVYQARLLVGADGQNSPVRHYADIASRGWSYDRWGVVGTLRLQYDDFRAVAWQRFLTTGPLALLPLPEGNATFVWSTTPDLADLLLRVDAAVFPHLLNAALTLDETDLNYIYGVLRENPADASVVDDIAWRTSKIPDAALDNDFPVPVAELVDGSRARFPLKLLHADTYVAPRVALVGDAAHTVHPLAGQGLNMGQSDVAALVEALEVGVDRGLDLGSTLVLERYVAAAWPANHALMGVCDKLHKLFSTDLAPVVFVRGLGMKTLNMLGGVKDLMMQAVSGR